MKKFNILNLTFIILTLIGDVFYIIFNNQVWIKALASLGFVAIGVVNLIYVLKTKNGDKKFSIIMLTGLVTTMLADVVLEYNFIAGAALFAVGHIFYFVAYCTLIKFKWKDLIAGVCIFVPSCLFIVLAPIFTFEVSIMKPVCVIYALIISLMVGKSISNLIKNRNIGSILLVVGSILFFFSDLMLLLNKFAGVPATGILCLATYYPAQCILAYSICKSKKY